MLKNDEIFWHPSQKGNASCLSWGGSDGDFTNLWDHSLKRWQSIVHTLRDANVPSPRGKIVEFGSGMGLLDELLDDPSTEIVMLDHTTAYIEQRATPLSSRCRHVLFTRDNLARLQQSEAGSCDWLVSIAVFYHVDEATAVALIQELGKLLKPKGHVLIHGWLESNSDALRTSANLKRLFVRYPEYFINWDLVRSCLEPEYREVYRKQIAIYQKT